MKQNENQIKKEEKDDGNLFTYIDDKINYKVFRCYNLFRLNKLKSLLAFYVVCGVFLVILILNFIFFIYGLENIRSQMYKEIPTPQRVREMVLEELKKMKKNLKMSSNPIKKNLKKIVNDEKINKYIKTKKSFNSLMCITNNYKNNKISTKLARNKTLNPQTNKNNKRLKEKPLMNESQQKPEKKERKTTVDDDYNILPYKKAKRLDKRNIFLIFKSVLFDKLELVNLIISHKRIKVICICEYILSLLFDFFFNTLLYSDDVVSSKYHNNGKLDSFVSIALSLTSNIITSILCHFVDYSEGIEERLDQILEIKRENSFLYALNQFSKYLRIKMVIFLVTEIILVSGCSYYIILFCIIYSKSQKSLVINYIYSLFEGLAISLIVTFLIVITRKIGISCSSEKLYNTSKYLNEKF